MRQSLLEDDPVNAAPPDVYQAFESRWRSALAVPLVLSAAAFLAAAVALGIVILR
jgi:hypothetical protein